MTIYKVYKITNRLNGKVKIKNSLTRSFSKIVAFVEGADTTPEYLMVRRDRACMPDSGRQKYADDNAKIFVRYTFGGCIKKPFVAEGYFL